MSCRLSAGSTSCNDEAECGGAAGNGGGEGGQCAIQFATDLAHMQRSHAADCMRRPANRPCIHREMWTHLEISLEVSEQQAAVLVEQTGMPDSPSNNQFLHVPLAFLPADFKLSDTTTPEHLGWAWLVWGGGGENLRDPF